MTMLAEPIVSPKEKTQPNPHQLFPSEIEEMQGQEHEQSQGLKAELAFEGGLIRLYRDGKRVLTLLESQAELDVERQAKEAERRRAEKEQQRADAERLAKEEALAEIERLKKELEKR